MKLLRILLRVIAAICILLFVMGLAINLFDLFTFRKTDNEILRSMEKMAEFDVTIDTVRYLHGVLCYAGVRASGPGSRDAIIFVHGSPGALDAYSGYLTDRRLADIADLYSFDRPGFGQTRPRNAEPSLVKQVEALRAMVESVRAKRTILVGHSLGCSIIARFAMDHPQLADGLVMVAAPIDPALEPPNWWRYILNFPLIRIAVPRPLAISNAELLPLKKELESCLDLWERIDCPVLYVHGEHDQLVPAGNVQFGERVLGDHVKQQTVIIEGEGHFILWSHIDEIVELIISLLQE